MPMRAGDSPTQSISLSEGRGLIWADDGKEATQKACTTALNIMTRKSNESLP